MKQINPKKVTIAEVDFFITPFAAFYATNLSGEIFAVVGPLLTSIIPLLGDGEDGRNVLDMKVDEIMPSISKALSELDGDKLEGLMRKLLINKGNVAVHYTDDNGEEVKEKLTYDLANEIFCQNVIDMFRLAWEVISLNYGSFFSKMSAPFGKATDVITMKKKK